MKKHIGKYIVAHARVVIWGLVAVVAIGAVWYVVANAEPALGTYTAALGTVTQNIDEPAAVVAQSDNTALSFQESGRIVSVAVQNGDTVTAGEVLATLNQSSLLAALNEASSAVSVAKANLAILESGSTPQNIAVVQAQMQNAESSLLTAMKNAYAAASDAVYTQTDPIFTNPTVDPQLVFQTGNPQLTINVQNERLALEAPLKNWQTSLAAIATSSDLNAAATTAGALLVQTQSFLADAAAAVNLAVPAAGLSPTTISGWKTSIATGRAETNTASANVTAAAAALTVAQKQLALEQAPPTADQVAAQEAVVAQAESAFEAAQVALDEATLKAPFPGTVRNLIAQVGQVVSPGTPVLTLINGSGLVVQAYVSELDVTDVQVGDAATVTLDAFGADKPFPATVTAVDSAGTTVNGVPSYLVTLHFTGLEPQVRDGMTGDVAITIAEVKNVVAVPSRLVLQSDGQHFVIQETAGGLKHQPVQIGIKNDELTEIRSGVNAGDKLANF